MHIPKRTGTYPPQIWLLFWGSLISMTAQSLVWPFLTIHIREQLNVPLTQITLLFTLQSIASLASTAILGPVMDRLGRKWAMVGGPILSGLVQLAMTRADSLPLWAVLLSGYAIGGVTFRIGSQAMIADLVEQERRAGAYALLRMGFNVGIAVGPAVGGFLVATSYALSFTIAAGVQFLMAVLVLVLLRETLPENHEKPDAEPKRPVGYGPLLRDRRFMSVWGVYLLVELAASMVFMLLAVYIKEQYAIPENEYGFILGTNAAMVVLLQYAVTRRTERRAPLPVMALGALFYGLGMLSYALGTSLLAFWLGMVIMTVGELILVPTATALVANLAPPDMRARYMGVYGLSFRVGSGVGPVLGGFLGDAIAPAATWYGAMTYCLIATGGFLLIARSRMFQVAESGPLQPETSRVGD